MTTEETATAKKGGIRIAIDWTDGDSDDALRRPSPDRPSASRKKVAHDRRIHIDVCFTSPPSSALKVKGDGVFVDVRSSGDVSLRPAVSKGTAKVWRDAAEWESSGRWHDALRREVAGMSDGELRREIAALPSAVRRLQPFGQLLRPLLEAEARNRSGADVCFVSRAPAAAKGSKGRRDAAAQAEWVEMSNDGLRREIAGMSDGGLRRNIAGLRSPRSSAERRRRVLPLLEDEARRRRAKVRSGARV